MPSLPVGLEPTTSPLAEARSIQLSYRPIAGGRAKNGLKKFFGILGSEYAAYDRGMNDPNPGGINLLHPFYLDTDMSMAFAAALTGGVALETEEVETEKQESESLKNLRGNLRIVDLLGIGGERGSKDGEVGATESRLRREHTKASIFIGLYDELQRTGQIQPADLEGLEPGQLISLSIGPAVAPLRRIVDQVLRLLDVLVPFTGGDEAAEPSDPNLSRQQRRQQAREAAKALQGQEEDSDAAGLDLMRQVFIALQDDLERSGMVDVVVQRDDAPNVILTLDERFITGQVLELLHTSKFTVIGKVTQVWPNEDEFVNLYRRSVLSLAPALVQTMSMGMLQFLIGLARGVEAENAFAEFQAEMGIEGQDKEGNGAEEESADDPDVMISPEAVNAVLPGVSSPAFQLLPLAICA